MKSWQHKNTNNNKKCASLPSHSIGRDVKIAKGRNCLLGTTVAPKMDVFLENFQTALTPPLLFWKLHCAFFSKIYRYYYILEQSSPEDESRTGLVCAMD